MKNRSFQSGIGTGAAIPAGKGTKVMNDEPAARRPPPGRLAAAEETIRHLARFAAQQGHTLSASVFAEVAQRLGEAHRAGEDGDQEGEARPA